MLKYPETSTGLPAVIQKDARLSITRTFSKLPSLSFISQLTPSTFSTLSEGFSALVVLCSHSHPCQMSESLSGMSREGGEVGSQARWALTQLRNSPLKSGFVLFLPLSAIKAQRRNSCRVQIFPQSSRLNSVSLNDNKGIETVASHCFKTVPANWVIEGDGAWIYMKRGTIFCGLSIL